MNRFVDDFKLIFLFKMEKNILNLNILICQTDCEVGKTSENIVRWNEKLADYSEKD